MSEIDWFPLWLSLRVAGISTLLSIAIGVWIAHALAHRVMILGRWVGRGWRLCHRRCSDTPYSVEPVDRLRGGREQAR